MIEFFVYFVGLTESCGGCFTSIANVFPMIGTVGVPMTTIEARLESVPEMGYDALSAVPRGEICLQGNTLFSGYHKRQDLTNEVLVDGWFHTGTLLLQPYIQTYAHAYRAMGLIHDTEKMQVMLVNGSLMER